MKTFEYEKIIMNCIIQSNVEECIILSTWGRKWQLMEDVKGMWYTKWMRDIDLGERWKVSWAIEDWGEMRLLNTIAENRGSLNIALITEDP